MAAYNRRAYLANAQMDEDNTRNSFRASSSLSANLMMTSIAGRELTCTSCDEKCGTKSLLTVCSYVYCNECLISYVDSSLQPGQHFPPHCCSIPITLQHCKEHLSPELVQRYEAKQAHIAASCSLLCAEPGCRIIIPEEKIVKDIGNCPGCNRNTCIRCRTAEHAGKDCPTNRERQELLDLAKEKGWQECYRCSSMIEQNMGCNHMT